MFGILRFFKLRYRFGAFSQTLRLGLNLTWILALVLSVHLLADPTLSPTKDKVIILAVDQQKAEILRNAEKRNQGPEAFLGLFESLDSSDVGDADSSDNAETCSNQVYDLTNSSVSVPLHLSLRQYTLFVGFFEPNTTTASPNNETSDPLMPMTSEHLRKFAPRIHLTGPLTCGICQHKRRKNYNWNGRDFLQSSMVEIHWENLGFLSDRDFDQDIVFDRCKTHLDVDKDWHITVSSNRPTRGMAAEGYFRLELLPSVICTKPTFKTLILAVDQEHAQKILAAEAKHQGAKALLAVETSEIAAADDQDLRLVSAYNLQSLENQTPVIPKDYTIFVARYSADSEQAVESSWKPLSLDQGKVRSVRIKNNDTPLYPSPTMSDPDQSVVEISPADFLKKGHDTGDLKFTVAVFPKKIDGTSTTVKVTSDVVQNLKKSRDYRPDSVTKISPTASPTPDYSWVLLALDKGHFDYLVAQDDDGAAACAGARVLLQYQTELDWANHLGARLQLADRGIRDVQSDTGENPILIPADYTLVAAYYRIGDSNSAPDDYSSWIPVSLNTAGFQSIQIIGKQKYMSVSAEDKRDDIVVDPLDQQGSGFVQEDPHSFLTITLKDARNGKIQPENLYIKPNFGFQRYGLEGFWLPIGLLGIHQNKAGQVSTAGAPISLAWGLKDYHVFGGLDYLGVSMFGNLGNDDIDALFSGQGETFTYISYGVLFDFDNYFNVGAAIERDFSTPNGVRGMAMIGLNPAFLEFFKSTK